MVLIPVLSYLPNPKNGALFLTFFILLLRGRFDEIFLKWVAKLGV